MLGPVEPVGQGFKFYSSGAGGECRGVIEVPEIPANRAWGGDDGQWLFITACTGIYKVHPQWGRLQIYLTGCSSPRVSILMEKER